MTRTLMLSSPSYHIHKCLSWLWTIFLVKIIVVVAFFIHVHYDSKLDRRYFRSGLENGLDEMLTCWCVHFNSVIIH